MKKDVVYISGPMTGYEDFNRDSFFAAQDELEKAGVIVLNPAWMPDGLTNSDYAMIDNAMLMASDAVYMLRGWGDSLGAKAEHALAVKLNKMILYETVDGEAE